MTNFLNKSKFEKWLQTPNFPLLVSGRFGIGKTFTIEQMLNKLGMKYKFIHCAIPSLNNIFEMIHNKREVYIIDDCDTFDFKELQDMIQSVLKITKLCICIAETNTASLIEGSFVHYVIKQVSYSTFHKLVKNKEYDREYYDKDFNGDLRQIMIQAKVVKNQPDKYISKENFFLHKKYDTIKDHSTLFNILCESYIYNQVSPLFVKRLSDSFYRTNSTELNVWINLLYPLYDTQISNLIYGNKHWTRMSNIKYRKKIFQTIRRSISSSFIGYESYYKIIMLRYEILNAIKQKEIKRAASLLKQLNIDSKMVNFLPKLQCDDEFTKYTTRLKPLYTYIRKQ